MARIAFLGSPDAAVAPLRSLVAAGNEVSLVVSQPDKRRGRGGALVPSPVKKAALELGLPVTDQLDEVLSARAEIGVVVAYGRIIPKRILDELDILNLHFSLLPRWRGAAPVERALLAGDRETGVCLMRLELGLDTGPVMAVRRVAIGAQEHASELTVRLSELGADLLVESLAEGVAMLPPGTPQIGEPTYASKLEPVEFRLDWNESAEQLARVVRLDRAWTTFHGTRLRVLRASEAHPPVYRYADGEASAELEPHGAASTVPGSIIHDKVRCGTGWLELQEVQPEGKRPLRAIDWLRGARPFTGDRLGDGADGK